MLIGISGLTLALPAGGLFGFSQISLLIVAAVFLIAGIVARAIFSPAILNTSSENQRIN